MNINSEKVKQLRTQKGWSQEQLSEFCGVNLRTIQRLEKRGTASQETLKALASVFEVDAQTLLVKEQPAPKRALTSVLNTVKDFDDFQSRADRYEFWWFFIFFVLVLALAETIHLAVASAVAIIFLMPFLAVSTRRLRDTGQSVWWQLMYLVPFGVLLVLYYLAMPSMEQQKSV